MDNNDDWNKKKEGFMEVFKLMEMINKNQETPEIHMAHVLKDQFDAFMAVGFTREEAMELTKSLTAGIVGGLRK